MGTNEGDLRWEGFERVDMRVGRIVRVAEFPEAQAGLAAVGRLRRGRRVGTYSGDRVLLLEPGPGAALGDPVG